LREPGDRNIDTSDLPADSYPPLQLTGERTLPGIREENYWFQRHLAAYEYILPLVEGKRVLDLGCGEGYGVDLLASRAREAVGVDLAPEALYHARRRYRKPNLRFLYMDVYRLELERESFDVACSLQVIEHLHRPEDFLAEVSRILKPGGLCVLTTPNRLIISPGRETPVNPFHIREYDLSQFRDLMSRHFAEVRISGLFHARKLRLHDLLTGKNFSQFCLRFPPRLYRSFYLPWFLPSLTTRDFRVKDDRLQEALDFIGMGKKPSPGGSEDYRGG
jgi:SAM-dependent methyltransferase